MKKKVSIRLALVITSLLILFLYSSEIDFMPNYKERPDKIYLAIWMLLIYPILFFILGWVIFKTKTKTEKIEVSIETFLMIIAFAMLNNPKGESQMIGYSVISIIFIVMLIRFIIIKHKNCSS